MEVLQCILESKRKKNKEVINSGRMVERGDEEVFIEEVIHNPSLKI